MARTDNGRTRITKELLHRQGQIPNGGRIRLLNKQIPRIGVHKGKTHQLHRLIQIHQETGHLRIGNGNRMAGMNLVNEQRNHRTAAAHDIAVAGTADYRAAPFRSHTGIGIDNVFHHGLGNTHGINGIRRLICTQAHHPFYPRIDGRMEHVIRTFHIGLYRLHGKKLAAGHLLQGRRMENIIHPGHGIRHRTGVPYITYIKFYFLSMLRIPGLQYMPHIILFLLIP